MRRRSLSPAQMLSLHILGLVTAGGILLSLPISAAGGHVVSVLNAFFTSTSAVCVTGLVVIDTPKDLSFFGQVVLMLLIQFGGLGYMTISTLVMVAFGRRMSLQDRMTLADALNVTSMEGLLRFTGTVAALTLALEGIGALIMGVRFAQDVGWSRGLWFGLFHAVSAFNNAGFALFSDNLMGYRGDLTINLVITTLIICGGLGFFVLSGLLRLRRRSSIGMSTHTRLVLVVTGVLLVGGTAAILLLEWSNPKTLGPLGFGEKLLAAYFQAVTPRTAGFNTISIGDMTVPALFVTIVLMFIGASPGGTGGGVKTTTFGVAVTAIWSTVRGRQDTTMFRRRIAAEVVARAFAISLIAFLGVNLITGALLIVEGGSLTAVLYETTSAFGTVGLSMGAPGTVLSLSGIFGASGKLLIMLMMFVGRVGPLTLAIALAGAGTPPRLRYPEGKVLIG
ncbi:MAG: TrkH family potassium uptake protein [Acidobacteria bacterium]|nr:TrkH family potassium uptake protein [Acidobacteriota bacterium]